MILLHVKLANTVFEKTRGLLGVKKPYNLLLRTRFGIHTIGMSFPIDVVILDDTYHVVRLKKSLVPNRIFLWPPMWSFVIELPSGSINTKQIHIGDRVKLVIN